jgi:DNA helicase-2/ATP-dependent DNA helicase PcrA
MTREPEAAPDAPWPDPLPAPLCGLNEPQRQAVEVTDGPLLILAGAGSGKTRVLTRRIAYLLHLGVAPENILAVTFTNKAAAEMRERVVEMVGEPGRKVWVSTFHSSCCRILRAEAEALGFSRRFAIWDDDDQHRLMRQLIADHGYDPKVVTPGSILGRIDHHKNRLVTVEDLVAEHRAHLNDPLVRLWRSYEEALAASDAMDFNDLIGRAVQLFETVPAALESYRDLFHYVLVDEYQDTNRAQYRILKLLTAQRRNLAVVGDDDQSIYAFRGADIRNILDFEADFPDAKVIRLEQNYRSSKNILSVANAVVAKNQERIEKSLWTDAAAGPRVALFTAPDPRAEARLVVRAMQQLRSHGATYGDMAVIYRTNQASQPFESALREAGIPHILIGGRPFYSRREVRDTLAFLRLMLNGADDAAFLRVVNVPPRGIGPSTLTKLREEAANRGEPLLKVARSLARGGDRSARALEGFVRLIDDLAERLPTASLPALVHHLLQSSGYLAMLEEEDTPEAKGRLDNLQILLRDAATTQAEEDTPDERLAAWLDRVALAGSEEESPEGGQVTLMTVHTSKGLEFPVVFVVGMNEGQFPHARALEDNGGVAEERRLAYVAFTRAMQRLIVTRSLTASAWDGQGGVKQSETTPSRFLFGVPADSCSGDLPSLALPEHHATETARDPNAARAERLAKLMAHRSPSVSAPRESAEEDAEAPEGEYVLTDIEGPEDLATGNAVFHRIHGRGTVVHLSSSAVRIRFATGERRLPLGDPALSGLRDI